ncbi:hypothetical protein K461DRAFT_276924 [Myriangium duriaei CBS 260.36]|uniref:Uncharacterized protein n=1 Tax=Myriangium duriaei CBS 260.36 TaxID=1168546 RepID=A0A9P4J7J3_9PEZI|nr:hypothetical protein K461DRAFT_276924 [Myriangium duriaei CBS 260.36]
MADATCLGQDDIPLSAICHSSSPLPHPAMVTIPIRYRHVTSSTILASLPPRHLRYRSKRIQDNPTARPLRWIRVGWCSTSVNFAAERLKAATRFRLIVRVGKLV